MRQLPGRSAKLSKNDNAILIPVFRFKTVSGSFPDWLDSIGNAVDDETIIVLAPEDLIHGVEHLSSAIEHARRSISSGRSRARDPSIEVLRYLTGQRQVSRAIEVTRMDDPGHLIFAILIPAAALYDCGNDSEVRIMSWTGDPLPTLWDDHAGTWGGEKVRSRLGISNRVKDIELREAVLEMVAMTDL